jgi:hypothetical protein
VSFALFDRQKEGLVRDAAPVAAEVELRNMAQERFDRRTGRPFIATQRSSPLGASP